MYTDSAASVPTWGLLGPLTTLFSRSTRHGHPLDDPIQYPLQRADPSGTNWIGGRATIVMWIVRFDPHNIAPYF